MNRRNTNPQPSVRRHIRRRRFHSTCAASMSETLLVMPFLVIILALILYFGRDLVRVQHALVMDRSAAWQQVGRGPAPPVDPPDDYYERQLNQMFFAGRALEIEADMSGYFPDDAQRRLEAESGLFNANTQDYATRLFAGLPAGHHARLTTRHDETVPFWRQFQGPIRHGHTRIEHEWRYANAWRWVQGDRWRQSLYEPLPGQWQQIDPALDPDVALGWQPWPSHGYWYPTAPTASNLTALRDTFFEQFHSRLDELATLEPTGSAAAMLASLYEATARYWGPAVGFE